MTLQHDLDVIVIGGGQSGLAVGYYLRRTGLRYTLLDAQDEPGGAWLHGWDSLRLFSPARFSSLPGRIMPGGPDYYPTRAEAVAYLREYEEHYGIPVERPVRVERLIRDDHGLAVKGEGIHLRARAVVSATGTWEAPYLPAYPDLELFTGRQIHSSRYRSSKGFAGQRVLVIGGGNSGAQIVADLAGVADTSWVTLAPPRFLPDHIDGRYLFDEASAAYRALGSEGAASRLPDLGDVVAVPPVRLARDRGQMNSLRPFERFTAEGVRWHDGREERIDTVIWCTGFRPALGYLRDSGLLEADGRVRVAGNQAVCEPRLWLVGYGEWTGFASATLIGVGRTARAVVGEIVASAADLQAAPEQPYLRRLR